MSGGFASGIPHITSADSLLASMPSQSVNTLYCSFSSTGPGTLLGYQKIYIAATGQCINSNIICDQDGSLYVYGTGTQCQGIPAIYAIDDDPQVINMRHYGNVSAIMYTSILASEQVGWIAYTPSNSLVLGSFSDPTEITGVGFYALSILIITYICTNNIIPKSKPKDPRSNQKKDSKIGEKEIKEEIKEGEKKKVSKENDNITQVFLSLRLYTVLCWIAYTTLESIFVFGQNQFIGSTQFLQLAKRIFLNIALLLSTIEPVFLLGKYETTTKSPRPVDNLDALTRWSKAYQVWPITFFAVNTIIPGWVALNFVAPIKTMTLTDRLHSIRKSSENLISFAYADLVVFATYSIVQIVFLGTPALGNDKAAMASFGVNLFFYILQYTITIENIEALAVLKIKLRKKKGVKKDDLNSSRKSMSSRPDFAIARISVANQIQKNEDSEGKKSKDGKETKSVQSTASLHRDSTSSSTSDNGSVPISGTAKKQRKSIANAEGLKIVTRNNSIRTPSMVASPTGKTPNIDSLASREPPKAGGQSHKSLLISPAGTRRRGFTLMAGDNPNQVLTKNHDGLDVLVSPSRRRSHQEIPSFEIPSGIGRKIDEQLSKMERNEDKLSALNSSARRKPQDVSGNYSGSPQTPKDALESPPTSNSPSKSNNEIKAESPTMSSPGRRRKMELKSAELLKTGSDYKRQTSSLRQEVKTLPPDGNQPSKPLLGGNAIYLSELSINKDEVIPGSSAGSEKKASFNSNATKTDSTRCPDSPVMADREQGLQSSRIPNTDTENQTEISLVPRIRVEGEDQLNIPPSFSFQSSSFQSSVPSTIPSADEITVPTINEYPPSQESDNPINQKGE
ncbi:hypothetical protein HDV01_002047 [Terramyces sp. JEL0728]|nr:hypothetical protein HDV01_002047 [Terramyces sp. JEL0728]